MAGRCNGKRSIRTRKTTRGIQGTEGDLAAIAASLMLLFTEKKKGE